MRVSANMEFWQSQACVHVHSSGRVRTRMFPMSLAIDVCDVSSCLRSYSNSDDIQRIVSNSMVSEVTFCGVCCLCQKSRLIAVFLRSLRVCSNGFLRVCSFYVVC